MTRFQKVFLRDALHGRVILAGFGKHPAWDDHIDDIGLETESLVIAKRVIYSEGIASQISSGAWNQLENSRRASRHGSVVSLGVVFLYILRCSNFNLE